jgi:hypothetical protein
MAGDATTIRTIDQGILEIIEGVLAGTDRRYLGNEALFRGKPILPER